MLVVAKNGNLPTNTPQYQQVRTLAKAKVWLSNEPASMLIFTGAFSDREASEMVQLKKHLPIIWLMPKGEPVPENWMDYFHDILPEKDWDTPLAKIAFQRARSTFQLLRNNFLAKERLQLIQRATNEILWDWDLNSGELQYNSEGWLKVLGHDEFKGRISIDQWIDFIHPDDQQHVRNFFQQVARDPSQRIFNLNYRMQSMDGYIYVHENGFVVRDETGKAYRLVGSTMNVHDKEITRQELETLSVVIHGSNLGIIINDEAGNMTYANPSFSKLTGINREEALNTTLPSLTNDPKLRKALEKSLKQGKSFEWRISGKFAGKENAVLNFSFQSRRNKSGELKGYYTVVSDVSEQVETQKQVMETERRFRSLVENIHDGIVLTDKSGRILDYYTGKKILGFTEIDYSADFFRNKLHPDDRTLVINAFESVSKEPDKPVHIEYRIRNDKGTYTWLETTFYNLLSDPGIGGILSNFRDITYRKESEDLLRSSEKKYRNLFNENPLAILVWDPENFNILEANDAAVFQYGYDRKTLLTMQLYQLIHPSMRERLEAVVRSSRASSSFRTSYQSKHIDHEGRLLHVEISFHPVDIFGKRASMAIIKNITDQVELEARLSKERQLKQQEVTQATIIAQEQERLHIGRELHDNINQILATVRLYIEYAVGNPDMHDQLLKSAKELVLSAVNEIRNLSKSLLPPSMGEKGLAATLNDLIDSIRKINKYQFHTEWDVDEDKLPEELKLTVFRIIQEQLTNIFKHARATNISLSLTMKRNRLKLVVKDDGLGFSDVSNTRGVGLKNIRSRAELHNGTMTLKSVKGSGTELTVVFKLAE